jgi:DNA-directed RNA polymerase subunit RPC12/RpoP
MSEKVKYICDVNCPKCNALVIIKKRVKILVPAEPAEKEETYFAEKGVQMTLDNPERGSE